MGFSQSWKLYWTMSPVYVRSLLRCVNSALFLAALDPCLSLLGYTVQWVWKHFTSVKTGHLLSLIHSTITKSDKQFISFEHFNKHLSVLSTGTFQNTFAFFVLSKRNCYSTYEEYLNPCNFSPFVMFPTHLQLYSVNSFLVQQHAIFHSCKEWAVC